MLNTKFKERRKFVKLASGLLVSPFASLASRNSIAADDKPPLRMLTIIDTYGLPIATRNEIWVKSSAGDYALTDDNLGTILSPLKAYKDNMLVVSGINLDSLTETGASRTHQSLNTHTLTGSRKIGGTDAGVKIQHASLDVHVGEYLNNDQGLARAHSHLFFTNGSSSSKTTFCYDNSGTQVRSIPGAKNQASSIFASSTDTDNLQFTANQQQIVFDLVQKQVIALRGQLNNINANSVFDAYQSGVDDLATQLQISSENFCGIPGGDIDALPGASAGLSSDSTPYIFDNIQQAFACDLTSSMTYAIGSEYVNALTHGDLYNAEEHADDELKTLLETQMHAMSHQVSDVANKGHELVRIHQAEEIASLLDEMSNTTDTDGSSVLDNTVIFWTSAMSSNTHKADDYAYLLIAGKNTNLEGGFHYDCAGSTNNDLLTTIAQGLGLPDTTFGGHNYGGRYLAALQNGPISKMLAS